MNLDRCFGNVALAGDRLVGKPLYQVPENLLFTLRQPVTNSNGKEPSKAPVRASSFVTTGAIGSRADGKAITERDAASWTRILRSPSRIC